MKDETIEAIQKLPDDKLLWVGSWAKAETGAKVSTDDLKSLVKELLELRAKSAELEAERDRLRAALARYAYQCDECHHAKIMHLHDGEMGACISVDCYDPKCERFTNAAASELGK